MKKWYALLLMTSFVYAKQDCCLLGQIRSILANLQSQISGQFVINNTVINETFTIVENIESIVDSLAGCATIPITAPATITEPGSYCLENNSTDNITISSSNVSLNLNNHSLGEVTIGAFNNVTVFNGFVQGGPGITLFGSTNVELAHLQMNATTANGITIGNASAVAIHDVTISNAVGTAIDLVGGSFNITIKDVLISGGGITVNGISFAAAPGARDVFIESTAVYNCDAHGFRIADGASMINCAAAYNGGNGIRIQESQSAANTDSSTYVQDCVVMNNDDDGVHIIGCRVTLVNVASIGNGADVSSSDRRGFYATSDATVLMFEGCVAESNGAQGFLVDNSPAPTGTMRGCSAINNGSFGFHDPAGALSTIRYINNIASNNTGGNYNVAAGAAPFYSRDYEDVQDGTDTTAGYWNNVAAPNTP